MWLRWHSRIYLGETSSDPHPLCPLCCDRAEDSLWHFAKNCRAVDLKGFLSDKWFQWTGKRPPDVWWRLEWSPDWRWMLCFSLLLYSLYWYRYAVIRGEFEAGTAAPLIHHFRCQLFCALDLVSYEPPAHGARPCGNVGPDQVFLTESSANDRQFDVILCFKTV